MNSGLFRFVFAAAALFMLANSAHAQDAVDCANAQTQADMNICSQQDFDTADAAFNALWPDAQAFADGADVDLPADQQGYSQALLESQRAWLAFRDAECTLQGFGARGGSLEPMLISGCKATLTNDRVKALQAMIDGEPQ